MAAEALLLGFPEYETQAKRIARSAKLPFELIAIHHFPDGESRLRVPEQLPGTVIVCRSLNQPNDKLIELLLTAAHLREQRVRRLILLAPYLCYMRQDKAFTPGEVVSQRHLGGLLADYFDALITVDAHLHRIHDLAQAVPVEQALNLTATQPMAAFLHQRRLQPLLVGPDRESEQWVSSIAQHQGLEYRVADKRRLGDRKVAIALPDSDFHDREILLVDDVASTGRTLETAAKALYAAGAATVSVLVAHALFLDNAVERLRGAGVTQVWSCDTIPHPSNRVCLDRLLGDAVLKLLQTR